MGVRDIHRAGVYHSDAARMRKMAQGSLNKLDQIRIDFNK